MSRHGTEAGASSARVCFELRVHPHRLDEYIERHTPVWPEMLAEIAASGPAQLLAVPRRRRPAHRLLRDRRRRGRAGLPRGIPRRRRGGRPRWAGSSSASTAAPTRPPPPSPRSSTSKTSSPRSTRRGIHHDRRKRRIVSILSPDILQTSSRRQAIELPSWAFGNSGTRFRVFDHAGTPRDPFEKIADAARGQPGDRRSRPTVALHIPWDKVDSTTTTCAATPKTSASRSARSTRTRSRTRTTSSAPSPTRTTASASKAIDHHLECIDIMDATGSRDLKIWLAEGSNYPGQADMRARQDRLHDSLRQIYDRLGDEQRLVLEYKFFEPAFYHTDVPDWGTSLRPGRRARRPRDGLPRHRPPRAGHEHRVHRHAAAAPRQARLVRLQLALLRRRRPHRRRRRPVPAVPHHLRGHPRRRPEQPRRRVHARPVPQHRGRRSPARSARCSTCRR